MRKTAAFLNLFLTALIMNYSIAQSLQTDRPIKFLALGDSYTIGESVEERHRWPVQLAAALEGKGLRVEPPVIVATTGWRTDDLMGAVAKSGLPRDFDLVSLLIGVNNQYQGKSAESYRSEFEELLQFAIASAGGRKENVIVLSIPDYGFTPFGLEKKEKISRDIDEFNAVNKALAQSYGVKYFDITPISRRGLQEPELVASDGLHPSGKMYAEWVKIIQENF